MCDDCRLRRAPSQRFEALDDRGDLRDMKQILDFSKPDDGVQTVQSVFVQRPYRSSMSEPLKHDIMPQHTPTIETLGPRISSGSTNATDDSRDSVEISSRPTDTSPTNSSHSGLDSDGERSFIGTANYPNSVLSEEREEINYLAKDLAKSVLLTFVNKLGQERPATSGGSSGSSKTTSNRPAYDSSSPSTATSSKSSKKRLHSSWDGSDDTEEPDDGKRPQNPAVLLPGNLARINCLHVHIIGSTATGIRHATREKPATVDARVFYFATSLGSSSIYIEFIVALTTIVAAASAFSKRRISWTYTQDKDLPVRIESHFSRKRWTRTR